MKLKLMTATAAVALVMGGSALADDNDVYIDQIGGNLADIAQLGNNNRVGGASPADRFRQNNAGPDSVADRNILTVLQDGNGNQIQTGEQSGARNTADVNQLGNANRLGEVTQIGSDNNLNYDANSSFNNEAIEIENGAGNPDFADAVSGLSNDQSGFVQLGDANNIDITVTSIDNYSRVEQDGDENSVEGFGGGSFTIDGTEENLLSVTQDGSFNLVAGSIDGSSNVFTVFQGGNDNVVSASQTGLNNTLTVIQD